MFGKRRKDQSWEPVPFGEPVIEVRNLSKSFGPVKVFEGVSLDIPAGQTTAIIGPSGSGKSVLLKLIVGLLEPDQGEIRCFGIDMVNANELERFSVRRRFGMLFQQGALFDSISVGENVGFPLVHHSKLSAAEQRDRVDEVLEWVELPGFADRPTSALSGGQRKRVGLARAIVMEPEVVLFDEPNSGLDPLTSESIDELIVSMKERLGCTFVVISHDIVGTVNVADHIAMLWDGGCVAHAPTYDFVRSEVSVVRRFLERNLHLPEGPDDVATLPSVG